MKTENNKESNSYLTFRVGGENFAAHVNKVLNILELCPITRVPQAPEYMLGVINLRGSVLPVVDSRVKFGMKATENTKNTFIIVMEVLIDEKIVQIGALVDAVNEVAEVDEQNILPPPSIGNKYKADFISGVFSSNSHFTMILDVDKAFATNEILNITTDNN